MNLGAQTGSVINHLHSRAVIGQPEPKPGMGCTILKWSDRDAATIRNVFNIRDMRAVQVTCDRAKVIKGILWPEPEPLFHIMKDGLYFAPNYSGYRDNPIDAGKYTKDELRPYADGIKRGDLQAVPV